MLHALSLSRPLPFAGGHAARPPRQWLVAALAVSVITFLASTTYSQLGAAAIDEQAASIMADASPSIDRLYDARAGLLAVQSAVEQYLIGARTPRATSLRANVTSARAQLDDALGRYVRLHRAEPQHAAIYDASVAQPLAELRAAIDGAMAQLDAGDAEAGEVAIERRVRPLFATTWSGMWRLVEWNNADVRRRVVAMVAARHKTTSLAFTLDALSAGLVVALGLGVVHTMRANARRIAERELALQERADAFEQFASRVAHDIANPLNAAQLSIQMLARSAHTEGGSPEVIARANRAVRRCGDLVSGLLDFARAGARPEVGARTSIAEVVADVVEQITATEGSAFTIVVEPFVACAVASSSGVLASVVMNLLGNAAKHTRGCASRRATLRVVAGDERVRVEIEDTGPGVPSDVASTIFEPYVRVPAPRQAGLGLGLATVKRLCEGHGGTVGVRAAPGGGSLFWFELPRAVTSA